MREGFPTIEKFESFKPEDAEKLSEIGRMLGGWQKVS